MTDSVKVAVRVRPFNRREKERDSHCIIKMKGAQTIIVNPENEKEKPFTFDFSYNSFVPRDAPDFASQMTVWGDIGVGVLANAYEGYNCSLFAYGQTGAGKSYSMMGYGEDKGIIPIACARIFDRVDSNTDDTLTFTVTCSMLEIYMEKVRDLFNPQDGHDLKVRNDPKKGFYVDKLTASEVRNYEQISALMAVGEAARTVASTNMNATSSRAHTIFQIGLKQTKVDAESMKATDKTSLINLIDLAGSERQKSTGAGGDRLKEGAAINLSLSSLGNCISALAKNSGGGKKKTRVPYRDSVLTMLLQNSLGGNAKTIMIAAVSPASINYDETLGTLRYADRAKQIKNKAVINEDPNEKLIRQLKEEIDRLRAALGGELPALPAAGGAAPAAGAGAGVDVEAMRKEMEAKIKAELMSQSSAGDQATAALLASGQASLRADGVLTAEELAQAAEKAQTVAHLRNLNEDPQLDRKLYYFLEEGKDFTVGRKGSDPAPSIPLAGLSIQPAHAHVGNTDGKFTLTPTPGAKVVMNGVAVTEPTELTHRARLLFGNNHVFVVVIPTVGGEDEKQEGEPEDMPEKVTFDYAIMETNRAQVEAMAREEEKRRQEAEEEARKAEERIKALEAKMEVEKAAAQQEALDKAQAANEEEQARLMAEAAKKQAELERKLQEQVEESRRLQRKREKEMRERSLLDEKLLKTIPLVNEANAIADELSKSQTFEVKLMPNMHKEVAVLSEYDDEDEEVKEAMDTEVYVRVHTKGSDAPPALWHYEKFMNRLYIMREMFQQQQAAGGAAEGAFEGDKDPFYDPVEAQVIGKATIYLNALVYNLPIDEATPIIDYKGKEEGELLVKVVPHLGPNMPETEEDEEEDMPDEISELLGKKLHITVCVNSARGLPGDRANHVAAMYKFFLEDGQDATPPHATKTTIPQFDFRKTYDLVVTEELVKYVTHDAIELEVWGAPDGGAPPPMPKRRAAASGAGGGGAAAGGAAAGVASDSSEEEAAEPPPTFSEEEKAAIKAATEAGEELDDATKAKVAAYQAWAAENPGSADDSETCVIM